MDSSKAVGALVGLVSAIVLWITATSGPICEEWLPYLPTLGAGLFVLQIICCLLLGYDGYIYVTVCLAMAACAVFAGLQMQHPALGWPEFGCVLAAVAGCNGMVFAGLIQTETWGAGGRMQTSVRVYKVDEVNEVERTGR
ncbi:MAG: hypothetical protein ACM359_19630 [Bacillota bacterium]